MTTWLEGSTRNDKPAGARLRQLLERDEILRVPGTVSYTHLTLPTICSG